MSMSVCGGRGGRSAGATRLPRPQLRSADTAMEFVTWVDMPEIAWFQLPSFFAKALPTCGFPGLWFLDDGCCSGVSWVEVEVTRHGYMYLNRGWLTLGRA